MLTSSGKPVGGTPVLRRTSIERCKRAKVNRHGQQRIDGAFRSRVETPRSKPESTWRWKRRSRVGIPYSRGIAGGYLRRSDNDPVRDPERHIELHPDGDRKRRADFDGVLSELSSWATRKQIRQRISTDTMPFEARNTSGTCLGEKITFRYLHGRNWRVQRIDFQYAHRLGNTIRLICAAKQTPEGLILSVSPALIPRRRLSPTVTGFVQRGWSRQVWCRYVLLWPWGGSSSDRGCCCERSDACGAGILSGSPERVSPFRIPVWGIQAHPVTSQKSAYYPRFSCSHRPGIIAALSKILAISTSVWMRCCSSLGVERQSAVCHYCGADVEKSVRGALSEMSELDFMAEPPLAMPMEVGL